MWLLALTLAGLQLDDGGGQCPSAAAVSEAFRSVAGENAELRERVELRRQPNGVHLRLVDGSGATLAERTLPGSECSELARAAAVVLAAWRTEVAATTPGLRIQPPAPRVKPSWEVAAGFVGSFAGSNFAAGGELAAALGRRRWLGRVEVLGMDLRSLAIGKGQARFTRAGVGLGPMVRFHPRRWLLDLHAEATFAFLYMDAVGFRSTQSATAFDLGLGGGARAAIHFGRVAPFVGINLVGWPLGQSVRVSGPAGGSATLPAFEAWLQAGVAFGNY